MAKKKVEQKHRKPGSPRCLALVVGDWFVDEHWVCGVHRSPTSSRTGSAHLRALHPIKGTVQAFCGAGRTASFLHLVEKDDRRIFDAIVGLGFWHREDTDALVQLFNPTNPPQSPYRLTLPARTAAEGIQLLNMNDSLHMHHEVSQRDEIEHTTRIIRTYRKVERDRVSYERLDWDPQLPDRGSWRSENLVLLADSLNKLLGGREIDIVVIKDLLKGVVTNEIIEFLAKGPGKDAKWYVSSKKWKPEWFKCLSDVDLKLLLVPQVAADEAIQEEKLSCWITRSGRLSETALKLVTDLGEKIGNGSAFTVVLPGGFSALVPFPKRFYDFCCA